VSQYYGRATSIPKEIAIPIALAVGFLTPLCYGGVCALMLVAMLTNHLKNGFFAPTGVEFPLSLLGSAIALVIAGAGAFSLDALVEKRLSGSVTAQPEVVQARKRKVA